MGLNFIGGIGAAIEGYEKGAERRRDRARAEKQDAYVADGQDRQRKAWEREEKEHAIDDKVKTETQAIPQTRDGAIINPNRATDLPMTDDSDVLDAPPSAAQLPAAPVVQRADSELLRDHAAINSRYGRLPQALTFGDEAAKREMQRSAQLFGQIQAGAAGKDVKSLINDSVKVFNDDPGMAHLENVRYTQDGAVTFDAVNKQTGKRVTKTFADPRQLLNDLHAYYSPDSWGRQQEAIRASAIKKSEEDNKVHIIPAGGEAIKNDGRSLGVNDNGFIQDGVKADGTPNLVKAGGRAGAGKATSQPLDLARSILSDGMEKGDAKSANAKSYTRSISLLDNIFRSNPAIAPATAAAIAADAADAEATGDVKKISYQISDADGTVSKVYSNPDYDGGKPFNLAPNGATLKEFEARVGADGMAQAATGLLGKMGTPAQQEGFLRAAHDPAYRTALLSAAKAQGRDTEILGRKIDLLKALPAPSKTPGVTPDKPSAKNTLKTTFGLGEVSYTPPAGSPAAAAQATREKARLNAQAKTKQVDETQQALSLQFKVDSKTLTPLELVRKYDILRRQLPVQDSAALRAAEQTL